MFTKFGISMWLEREHLSPFEWTRSTDGKTYTVRFMHDNLQRSVLWKVLYDFGLDLIEVN